MITTIEGETMGGLYRLRVPTTQLVPNLKVLVQSTVDLIDTQMSAWKPGSDLCRFNTSPIGDWVLIPDEMAKVVEIGLRLSKITNGALNICLGQQSSRFGFAPNIDPQPLQVIDPCVALELDQSENRLRRHADIALDLNSIAKGYAADLVCEKLRKAGLNSYMIEISGDIRAVGKRPDGHPWSVALELPLPDKLVPIRFVLLDDCAIACSGNYRQINGDTGHIINPRTGLPISASFSSVTVIANSAAEADALATAIFAMGNSARLNFVNSHKLATIFIDQDESGFREENSQMAKKNQWMARA